MQELVRQAEEQAKKLENGAGPGASGACLHHGELARGVSLGLRLQAVQARAFYTAIETLTNKEPSRVSSFAALGASFGIPTPICVLAYFIGMSKGWW